MLRYNQTIVFCINAVIPETKGLTIILDSSEPSDVSVGFGQVSDQASLGL